MAERMQCEFQLIRYVPDPVKNEFVNIGVLLRARSEGRSELRFTQDWGRVRCLDPDADTHMLEALEIEVRHRLQAQAPDDAKPILTLLESSLSNGVQVTEAKAYLAEDFQTGLENLLRQYVVSARRERSQRRGGRAALVAAMRTHFEAAGVWDLMRKQIAVASYTGTGDPLRIDCGYSNKKVKMFQAISLEANAIDVKLLAFATPKLSEGVRKAENKELELTAIVEQIGWPPGENEPPEERTELYDYAEQTLGALQIAIMATTDLPRLALAARDDLHV